MTKKIYIAILFHDYEGYDEPNAAFESEVEADAYIASKRPKKN